MKIKFKFIITIFILGCFKLNAIAETAKFYYAIDSQSVYKVNELNKLNWKAVKSEEQIKFGYNSNTTIWCKLIYNSCDEKQQFYWHFDNVHLDYITIFRDQKQIGAFGDRTNQKSSFLRGHSFPLENNVAGDTITLIAAVKKMHTTIEFSMSVQDTQALLQKSNLQLAIAFTFLGTAIILLALTCFVYYRLRKKWHLYYLLYTAMGILFVLVNLGILRYFIFSNFLHFSEVRIYSSCYWFLLMGIFLSETINFKDNNYRLYHLFMGIQNAVFALSILALLLLFTGSYESLTYTTSIIFILFLLNITVLIRAIWLAFKRSERLAKYVAISFLPHILWGLSLILNIAGFENYLKGLNWINWIIAYEMILFGWLLIKDYVLAIESNTLLNQKIIHTEKTTNKNIEAARLKERRQISDLLHDKISTDVARTMQSLDSDEVAKARDHISELGKNIRNLSHTILPVELEHGALAQALQHHVNNLNADRSTELISFQCYDFPEHIDQNLATSLYLTLIELLQNALKHAEAKHILVELYCYPTEYVFTVSDDGKGFSIGQQYGFGLNNISSRIKDLGGEFSLSSTPDNGVNCMLIIPIANTQ